jgi:hypothetical protein
MPDPDSSIYERAAALLQETSSIVFKALTKSGSFAKYEQVIEVVSPHSEFRRQISIEIARYIDGAWIEATSPVDDLKRKLKVARHTLKISRNRFSRANAPPVANPAHDNAFIEFLYYQQELNDHKLPRGRVQKESAAIFVRRAAEIFTRFTGRPATIINDRDGDNTGPFGELLKAIVSDTLCLTKALKLDPRRLSTNLARLARNKRRAPSEASRRKN